MDCTWRGLWVTVAQCTGNRSLGISILTSSTRGVGKAVAGIFTEILVVQDSLKIR